MRKPTTMADCDAMQRLGLGSDVVVRCGRGEAHVRFLREDARTDFVIDADARVAHSSKHRDATQSLDALAGVLGLAPAAFANLPAKEHVDAYLAEPAITARIAAAAARVEAAPLRLWEAMLWRGHDYGWELVTGEVPLVGELWSVLGANRTLMQCVQDAEHAFAKRASEEQGWIHCGPMRMRQAGTQVEIRVRPAGYSDAVVDVPSNLAPTANALEIQAGLHLADGFYFRYLRRRG